MSTRKLEKLFHEIGEKSSQNILEQDTDISNLVIPFSKLCRTYKSPDIYSGKEKIPFDDRDPDYKRILKQEFDKNFMTEFKIYRPVIKFPSF
ncbi:MAG: hypothetical protein ACFFCV_17150 [Promethearchaeota archaeon]